MAALPASADPAVLVALGDSLTQGYGLPPEDGLVPQLQGWLTDRGAEVTVVNAGVSGDTTAGGAARIGWTLEGGADVLLIALGGNDLLRGLPPEETRANVTAMLEAAQAKDLPVLLAAIPAPGNFGPDYKADFDAIWPELAAEYGAVLVPNMLAGLADLPPEARTGLVQSDGIHPTARGAAIIAETLGPPLLDLIGQAGDPAQGPG
ncbi:arylesterase [Frigidibacter oleivorans]|uniref:arylesterase n=1 Tax=Frigidibacter oleivorans TaxID=2487129 RepID=UPI001F269A12|nr:arylesterase [Frigidibacter oleivorans]